jgi:hypothetical protein
VSAVGLLLLLGLLFESFLGWLDSLSSFEFGFGLLALVLCLLDSWVFALASLIL